MRPLVLAATFVAVAACSGPPQRLCTPGRTEPCSCLGGVTGAQTCSADGLSLGMCQCTSPVGGGNAGTGGGTSGGNVGGGSAGGTVGGGQAGGMATAGGSSGGNATAGGAAGGDTAGGTAGGATAGGVAGGITAGGAAGGATAGGTAGGATAGGAAGGAAAGGTAGGATAGGTAGGATAGGASGGATAGGTAGGATAGGAAGGATAGGTAGGSGAGGAGAGGASPDITGTSIANFFLANGTTATVGLNLTTLPIEAYVRNGTAYTVIPGTGQVNGTFTIPNVPVGTVLIRMGRVFLETTSRTVAFPAFEVGRPAAATATVDTPINVALAGLQPWAAGQDQLVWFSPNLGNTFYNFPLVSPPPTGAVTTTMAANFPNGLELVNQAQGDTTWALQLRVSVDAGVVGGQVIAASQLPPFTQVNGQPTSLSATMVTPPALPTVTQSLNWNLNAFSALQAQLPPGLNPRGGLIVFPFPATPPREVNTVQMWFAELSPALSPPTSLTVATPFPSTWSNFGRVYFVVDTSRQVAGTTGPVALSSGLGHTDVLTTLTSSPITPRLGPPGGLTLNGTPFISDRPAAGTTLTFGWTPPTLGTVTTYYVDLYRLTTAPGAATSIAERFTFSTASTTLTIPSGLVIAGQPYVVEVSAMNASFNARAEFGTVSVPRAFSFIVSPVVVP